MDDQLLDSNETDSVGQRPTFLTVLCILTFIGSGLAILGGIIGFFGSSTVTANELAIETPKIYTFINLVSVALSLAGALMMWNLQLKGFKLYVASAAISILMSFISIFTMAPLIEKVSASQPHMEDLFSTIMWTSFVVGLLINVAFVLMYNANRKFLK